jgi:hypothetical protein
VTYKLHYKSLFSLCLISLVILMGCSKEDQSSEQPVVDKKPEVSQKNVVPKPKPQSKRKKDPKDIQEGFRQDYSFAMQAIRDEDYALAIQYLNKAIVDKNDEELVVKFYGMRYGSYLPHFYLGKASYLSGDCETALTHWDISLTQSVIKETPSYEYLKEAAEVCKS